MQGDALRGRGGSPSSPSTDDHRPAQLKPVRLEVISIAAGVTIWRGWERPKFEPRVRLVTVLGVCLAILRHPRLPMASSTTTAHVVDQL